MAKLSKKKTFQLFLKISETNYFNWTTSQKVVQMHMNIHWTYVWYNDVHATEPNNKVICNVYAYTYQYILSYIHICRIFQIELKSCVQFWFLSISYTKNGSFLDSLQLAFGSLQESRKEPIFCTARRKNKTEKYYTGALLFL